MLWKNFRITVCAAYTLVATYNKVMWPLFFTDCLWMDVDIGEIDGHQTRIENMLK